MVMQDGLADILSHSLKSVNAVCDLEGRQPKGDEGQEGFIPLHCVLAGSFSRLGQ